MPVSLLALSYCHVGVGMLNSESHSLGSLPRIPPSMKTRELGALVYAAYVSTTIYLTVITTTDDCRQCEQMTNAIINLLLQSEIIRNRCLILQRTNVLVLMGESCPLSRYMPIIPLV